MIEITYEYRKKKVYDLGRDIILTFTDNTLKTNKSFSVRAYNGSSDVKGLLLVKYINTFFEHELQTIGKKYWFPNLYGVCLDKKGNIKLCGERGADSMEIVLLYLGYKLIFITEVKRHFVYELVAVEPEEYKHYLTSSQDLQGVEL